MANEFDDDLLNEEQTTPPAAGETPPAPQHSPLALAMARELGIETEGHTPESLQSTITAVRRHVQSTQKPAEPVVEQDEPISWGKNADGTLRTEAQFLEQFDPEIAETRRMAHEARVESKKLRKANEQIQQTLERERAERTNRAVERQLTKILAERPDLFGEKPGTAQPGTPEHTRTKLVLDHLQGLVAAKQHTTLDQDARAAMALFAPAETKPNKTSPLDAYKRAELARASQRKHGDNRTARQIREEQVAAKLEANGYVASGDVDDDADLLD